MLWSEPYGGGIENDAISQDTELYIRNAKFGERVYSTIRRFVIVRAKKGHSVCV
jgi:hypothetical protein